MLHCFVKRILLLLIVASLLALGACSKFEPILPEERTVVSENVDFPLLKLSDSPWITIQAGAHSLTNENESQIAASDIMGYINSITKLTEDDPHYDSIRQYVFDCFNVLQQLQLTFNADGTAQLEPLPDFVAPAGGTWQSHNDTISLALDPIPTHASATPYTKQLAERFGGGTLYFQKEGATLQLTIDGHFVCDLIVAYAYEKGMSSAKTLEAFSNAFGGFNVVLAQSLSGTPLSPPSPASPVSPSNGAVAYEWYIVRAGSKNYITSEDGIIASANATMVPINTIYTHLAKGSAEYEAFRDEVAKCYRLFGEMNITLYKDGTASIDGIGGLNGKAIGTWKEQGEGEIAIQILSVPLRKTANRFELRFADEYLASPTIVHYNGRTGDRTWHIPGPFVIEPCGDYVKENGLSGYDGIMRFSKVFKGFDLYLADR